MMMKGILLLCVVSSSSLAQLSADAAAGKLTQPAATAQIQAAAPVAQALQPAAVTAAAAPASTAATATPAISQKVQPAVAAEVVSIPAASANLSAASAQPSGPSPVSSFLAAPAPVTQAASKPATAAGVTAPAVQGATAVPAASTEGAAAAPQYGPEWHVWHPFRIWPELTALEQLLAGITFATMIKALCLAGNVIVQISPYPQVKRWEMRRDTGETDAAPYVAIAFGGWQWCYYGFFAYFITQRSGFLILVHSNCLGAVLGTYYNFAFFSNCKSQSMRQSFQKYLAAVTSLVLLQICALLVMPTERALFMSGLISSFCSFMGAISMLVCVPAVIQSKDSRAIPGPLVLANAASALVWCICGWMLSDPLIAAPNVVGFSSSSLCLYLKYIYPSSDEAADCESLKGKLKNVVKDIDALDLQSSKKEPLETTPLMPASAAYTSCGTGGTF